MKHYRMAASLAALCRSVEKKPMLLFKRVDYKKPHEMRGFPPFFYIVREVNYLFKGILSPWGENPFRFQLIYSGIFLVSSGLFFRMNFFWKIIAPAAR